MNAQTQPQTQIPQVRVFYDIDEDNRATKYIKVLVEKYLKPRYEQVIPDIMERIEEMKKDDVCEFTRRIPRPVIELDFNDDYSVKLTANGDIKAYISECDNTLDYDLIVQAIRVKITDTIKGLIIAKYNVYFVIDKWNYVCGTTLEEIIEKEGISFSIDVEEI